MQSTRQQYRNENPLKSVPCNSPSTLLDNRCSACDRPSMPLPTNFHQFFRKKIPRLHPFRASEKSSTSGKGVLQNLQFGAFSLQNSDTVGLRLATFNPSTKSSPG